MRVVRLSHKAYRKLLQACNLSEDENIRSVHIEAFLDSEGPRNEGSPPTPTKISRNEAASQILDTIKGSEPEKWSIIQDLMQSRGLSPLQYLVGILLRCGDLFELSNPMEVREYLLGDEVQLELPDTECPACLKVFEPMRRGQVFCSNVCGVRGYPTMAMGSVATS